jgi:hypothetical protein
MTQYPYRKNKNTSIILTTSTLIFTISSVIVALGSFSSFYNDSIVRGLMIFLGIIVLISGFLYFAYWVTWWYEVYNNTSHFTGQQTQKSFVEIILGSIIPFWLIMSTFNSFNEIHKPVKEYTPSFTKDLIIFNAIVSLAAHVASFGYFVFLGLLTLPNIYGYMLDDAAFTRTNVYFTNSTAFLTSTIVSAISALGFLTIQMLLSNAQDKAQIAESSKEKMV